MYPKDKEEAIGQVIYLMEEFKVSLEDIITIYEGGM